MTEPSTRVASLGIGVDLDFSDTDAQLAKYKQHVERETGIKLSFDNREALSATDRVKRDLEALGEVNKKQVASQVQASRFLAAQYELNRKAVQEQNAAVIAGSRQDQAAAQARTAQLREQAAQLSLNTRLAAKQRQDERDATRQTLGGIENQVKAYRDLWQARVLSNDQVYAQQGRLRDQALSLLLTVDKQSDAYRRLTAVAAAAQRSQDASMGINTPGGFGAGISQGITNALGQFGVTGDLIAGFIQMFSAKKAAAATEASNLGRDTMAGLVAGMKSNQTQVKEVANRAGDSVAEAIRVSLDIHSPSRVTEYLGKMAGLGFVTGVKSYQGEAAAAARALSSAAQGGLRNTSVSGGVFGGTSGNFDAGNLAASATALAALNQQLLAAQSAGEGAAEGTDVAAVAADGLGESVGGAADQVKTLRDAHNDQDAASRRAALNEAQTAIAFTATAAAVTAVAVALVASYNTAADYQKAMSGAKATTEATAEQLALLDAVARSPQFVQLGVGAKAAAAGIEELGSQGLSTADIMDGGLLVSLTLAKAVNTDVAKAAAVAASSTKAFGLEAKDLARIGDITTSAVNSTSIKMDSFSDAIAAGGDQAKRSGLNFTEFTAGISFLTDKAIGASDAGTSLKSFLMALTPNTKDAANEMKRLGFNAFDSQGNFKSLGEIAENLRRSFSKLSPEQAAVSAEMIFGSDGARVYGALVEQGNKGVQERITLLDRQGTMEEAARQKMEGARGAQEKLNAALENFKITAGSMLLGPAAKLLDWATNFLTKIDAVNQELAKVKDPGDIRATLKIDWAKDDATTVAYKLLVGGVEGTKNIIGQGIAQFSQTGFMQNIQRLDALQLQTQLQAAGVLTKPRNGDVGAATRQYDEVRANMPQYQQLLAEALIRNTAATEKATAAGTQSLQAGMGGDLITGRPLAARLSPEVDPGVLNGSGPLLPGQVRPGEARKVAGLWNQEFVSGLKDLFVSDPKIDSDCAIIASRILQAIGVGIKGSANAGTLAKEIKGRGGTQRVSQSEAQVGDYIDFAGPGFGLNSGHHSGVVVGRDKYGNLRYINNHGYGSRPGTDVPTTIDTFDPKYVAKRGTATFYRVAESPYAQGGRGISQANPSREQRDAALLAEAKRILTRLEEATEKGDLSGKVRADAILKAFEKGGPRAVAAVDVARKQLAELDKEVSKFGQGYDRFKRQLDTAESMFKFNDDATAYAKSLEGISKAAREAAAAEEKRYGDTAKFRALRDLSSDAASKARSQREAIERAEDKLSPLEREQQTLRETQAQDALEKSVRRASATRLRAIVEGGVQREGDLDHVQAAQKELDRREELGEKRRKEAQGKAAQVNEAIRQNDIAGARAALAELERQRDTGLEKVKGNLVAELAVQKQYADLIYNTRKAVLDKEKKDRDADINNSSLPQSVKTVQLAVSDKVYTTALAEADADKVQRLNAATTASAEASAQAQVDAQTRLNASTIEGMRVRQQAADQTKAAAQGALDTAEATNDRIIAGMQKVDAQMRSAAEAALARAEADAEGLKARLIEIEQDTLNVQTAGNKAVADDVIAQAAKLSGVEDFGGALTVLQNGLERLMTSALNGEPAAEGIDALVQAFNNLTDARARWRAEEQRIAGMELALTDPLKPTPARVNGSIRDTAAAVTDGGAVEARRTRPAARLNPDGTEYVDPGVAARDPQGAQRAEDWEAVMRAERVDTYRKSLEKLDLAQLEAAKSAAILSKDTARYQMIQDQITRTTEKNAADQATAIAQAAQEAENFRQAQLEGARADLEHEHGHNLISERTYLDRKQALDVAAAQAEYDAVKAAHGDLTTAGQMLQNKLTAIQREGSDARRALLISEAQAAVENFQLIAGSLSQLASAIGEGEEEYDQATGKKLLTPWKDVAANLDGAISAAGKLLEIGTDVMKLLANPADVGTWIKLATTVVSSIADAVAGFQKAQAEVRRLKEEFAQDNPFLNAGDYQKTFARSRGFFADFFGGGPEVVNEIDKVGLKFAQTMQGAFQSGIKNGLTEAIRKNDFSLFSDKLHEEVYSGLLEGVVDVFLNETLLKNIIAPAIKAWSDALKTPGTADDAEALAGIDVAVGMVDDQAARFYNDVAPRLQGLQDKWGLTPEETKGVDTTGLSTAPPAIQYALSTPLLEGVRGIKEAADILKEGATLIRDTFKDGLTVKTPTPAPAPYQSGTGAIIGR